MKTDRSFGIIPVHTDATGKPYFLLIRHTAGHWAFPKGHAEKGETELETARRELFEETGISDCEVLETARFEELFVIPTHVETFHKKAGEEVQKTIVYFVGKVSNTTVDIADTRGEITDFAWLPYEDALQKITFPETKEILIKTFNHITNTRV